MPQAHTRDSQSFFSLLSFYWRFLYYPPSAIGYIDIWHYAYLPCRQGVRRIGHREHKRRNHLAILCQLRPALRLLHLCILSLRRYLLKQDSHHLPRFHHWSLKEMPQLWAGQGAFSMTCYSNQLSELSGHNTLTYYFVLCSWKAASSREVRAASSAFW